MRNLLIAIAGVLLSAFLAPGIAAAPPPGLAQPKILVIDRQSILLRSSAGQSILQQARSMEQQLQKDFDGKVAGLRAEGAKLQQQAAILSNEIKTKKMRDLDSRGKAIQENAQNQLNQIKGGVLRAQQQLGQTLGPILKGIMAERGANMLLDRNAVILSTIDVDVTQSVIQRLNQKLTTIKVTPAPLPPGAQPPQ